MITKQNFFTVGLSKDKYTNEYIYIEAENIEEALRVTNEVLNMYYKDRKVTSISCERPCYRYV